VIFHDNGSLTFSVSISASHSSHLQQHYTQPPNLAVFLPEVIQTITSINILPLQIFFTYISHTQSCDSPAEQQNILHKSATPHPIIQIRAQILCTILHLFFLEQKLLPSVASTPTHRQALKFTLDSI
jgi:hypothetical protein